MSTPYSTRNGNFDVIVFVEFAISVSKSVRMTGLSKMETFQEAGVQMLKEFRALLQHSPLPLPGTRLLQLLALNMFAIETTQLKVWQGRLAERGSTNLLPGNDTRRRAQMHHIVGHASFYSCV
ncbi:Telomerase-binding protein EST1A [Acromyrmex echinatior]|uniref:Telomerase-binding protein EST1A n=1 Tax=Acromyrmex echinatior TaxID=103372 RepID=F4WS50_ACREC|nr:Telomerase-binding protein EST1A [Acromyrmex echinatior]